MDKTRRHTSLRKTASVSALVLTSLLFTGPASAQLATVDFAAIAQAIEQYAAQAEEYGKQAERWSQTMQQYQQQVAHYQQMIASVMKIDFSGMTISNKLTRIDDPSSFVAQACPGSGNIVGGALGAVGLSSLDLGGKIAQSQQQICQQITLLQIDKFNKTADLLNKMNEYGDLFKLIDKLRTTLGGASAIGDLQANTNEAARDGLKLAGDVENWRGQMMADDAAIQTLKDQQSILATIALKGSHLSGTLGSIVGNVVQAGAFAAAFTD